jgi:hypothetical protein
MPVLDPSRWDPSSREEERVPDETSTERFDRVAFANRALDLLRPKRTTIAVCEGTTRLRVEAGRMWGRGDERWAMVCVPKTASRRAIAFALVELAARVGEGPDGAGSTVDPYVLDVLLADDRTPYRSP